MNQLVTLEEANALIARGSVLHIAGVEPLLRQLNRGYWIGGTTPYMLTEAGGFVVRDKLFVTELPVPAKAITTRFVDIGNIPAISIEAPRNGFSLVIAPAMSEIHTIYSLTAANIPGIRDIALMGWIAGVHIDERHQFTPKVFDGVSGELSDDKIVVMHACLPPNKEAKVGVVNLVEPGDGDTFVFDAPGFAVRECEINGERGDFYAYAQQHQLEYHCPLVTDLGGEQIAVGIKLIDAETRSVQLYAPVMHGRVYRLGSSPPGYREELIRVAAAMDVKPVLTVNCVRNLAIGGLEGHHFNPLPGPAVFGELAHVLMNQTLVYLTIRDK